MISTITNQGKVRWMVSTAKRNTALFIVSLTRIIAGAMKKVASLEDNLSVHEPEAIDKWLADQKDRIELFSLLTYAPVR